MEEAKACGPSVPVTSQAEAHSADAAPGINTSDKAQEESGGTLAQDSEEQIAVPAQAGAVASTGGVGAKAKTEAEAGEEAETAESLLLRSLHQQQMRLATKLTQNLAPLDLKNAFCDIATVASTQVALLNPKQQILEVFCKSSIELILNGKATLKTLMVGLESLGRSDVVDIISGSMTNGLKGLKQEAIKWMNSGDINFAAPLCLISTTLALLAGHQALAPSDPAPAPAVGSSPTRVVTELPAHLSHNLESGKYKSISRDDILAVINSTATYEQYQKIRDFKDIDTSLGLPCAVGQTCTFAGLVVQCQYCPRGYHKNCLAWLGKMDKVPQKWICSKCLTSGKDINALKRQKEMGARGWAIPASTVYQSGQAEPVPQRKRSRKSRALGIKRRHTAAASHDLEGFVVDTDEDSTGAAEGGEDSSSEEYERPRKQRKRSRPSKRKTPVLTRQRRKSGMKSAERKRKPLEFNSDDEDKKERKRREIERDAEAEAGIKAEAALAIKAKEQQEAIRNAKPMVLASKGDDGVAAEIPGNIAHHLQKHQVEGVQFMWDTVIKGRKGCCLAHCMGLGKTFQVAALVRAITHADFGPEASTSSGSLSVKSTLSKLRCILCVVPVNVLINWKEEFHKWLGDDVEISLLVDAGTQNKKRLLHLESWRESGGVLVIGYSSFRLLSGKKQFSDLLLEVPDLVICDEGHMLRNAKSGISKSISKIRTELRIVLTGTPLQNNLFEYHTMIDWVRPGMLGTPAYFKKHFVTPILSGQSHDSTPDAVKLMQRRSHVLNGLLSGSVNRKQTSCLAEYLPKKTEFVVCIKLSPLQERLYTSYLLRINSKEKTQEEVAANTELVQTQVGLKQEETPGAPVLVPPSAPAVARPTSKLEQPASSTEPSAQHTGFCSSKPSSPPPPGSSSSPRQKVQQPFQSEASSEAQNLAPVAGPIRRGRGRPRKAATSTPQASKAKAHGKMLFQHYHELARVWSHPAVLLMEEEQGVARKKKGYDSIDDFVVSSSDESWSEDEGEAARERLREKHRIRMEEESASDSDREKYEDKWFSGMMKGLSCRTGKIDPDLSGKVVFLLELLKLAAKKREKVLVFTQSLVCIELMERILDFEGFGSLGKDYFKLDGSTPPKVRQGWVKRFNDPRNHRARLFLISTKAGGLGVNLTGGNRVVVFDVSWNPSYDTQAIARSFRFGQRKEVYVYRLLAQGTMEEKIYGRQVNKNALAARVVDMEQVNRKYTEAELQELYEYRAEGSEFTADKSRQAILKESVSEEPTKSSHDQSSAQPDSFKLASPAIEPAQVTTEIQKLKTEALKTEENQDEKLKESIAIVYDVALRRLIEQLHPRGVIGNFFEAKSAGDEDQELSPEEAAAAIREYENELLGLTEPASNPNPEFTRVASFFIEGKRIATKMIPSSKSSKKRRGRKSNSSKRSNMPAMTESLPFPPNSSIPTFSFPPGPSFSFPPGSSEWPDRSDFEDDSDSDGGLKRKIQKSDRLSKDDIKTRFALARQVLSGEISREEAAAKARVHVNTLGNWKRVVRDEELVGRVESGELVMRQAIQLLKNRAKPPAKGNLSKHQQMSDDGELTESDSLTAAGGTGAVMMKTVTWSDPDESTETDNE